MNNYKTIRCGRGLGDSLYLQSVCREYVKQGQRLKIATDFPDIFKPLGDMVSTMPFTRERIDIIAHYSLRKIYRDTTQFQDCCIQAGLSKNVEFKLDWKIVNSQLVEKLKIASKGKPILIVQSPRSPMNRVDGYGKELLPDRYVLQDILDIISPKLFTVLIGNETPMFELNGIDLDLVKKTSITDLLDIAFVCDAIYGYCSFAVPLAESFDKKALFVWSDNGLKSRDQFISSITPRKILHKPTSFHVVDNWTKEQITEISNAFLQQGKG